MGLNMACCGITFGIFSILGDTPRVAAESFKKFDEICK
jgi:hypothetical protein